MKGEDSFIFVFPKVFQNARKHKTKNLRAANGQPSTNTKTKLDLTKLMEEFRNSIINFAKLNIYCDIRIFNMLKNI